MPRKNKIQARRRVIFYVVCFLAILTTTFSACASQTAVPTQVSTKNIPTQRPLETSTLFPTFTPQPTMTIAPTPTLDNITALASEFDMPAVCLFKYQISKDRNWIGADCNTSHELIIVQKGIGEKIVMPYQDILDKNPVAFTIKPLSWSSDSRYFYFTTATVCCSVYNQHEGNGALYQYDTEKNSWVILVNASYEPYYFFSDDGERFIYINQSNNLSYEIEIGMVEILTKESKRVVLRGYTINDPEEYMWSRNADRFAIVLWELQSRNGTPGIVLLKIDFKEMDMEFVEEFNWNNLLGEN